MIGIDTNVPARILVADDPVQAELATRFIKDRCSPETPGFVNCVVLAELVWVLRQYRYSRANISLALEHLLASKDLVIEAHEQVWKALKTYQSVNCDFVDALIGELNRERGCERTATFDRAATKLATFVRVQ
jgi:predicted nucleic-acid-binding protein